MAGWLDHTSLDELTPIKKIVPIRIDLRDTSCDLVQTRLNRVRLKRKEEISHFKYVFGRLQRQKRKKEKKKERERCIK